MKQRLIKATVLSIILWLALLAFDYFDESTNMRIAVYAGIVLPFFPTVYYVYNASLKRHERMRDNVFIMLFWLLLNGIIGFIVCSFINEGTFIIKQHHGGFIDLNGIEYYIFTFFLLAAPTFTCLLYELVKALTNKIKQKSEN